MRGVRPTKRTRIVAQQVSNFHYDNNLFQKLYYFIIKCIIGTHMYFLFSKLKEGKVYLVRNKLKNVYINFTHK